MQHARAQVLGEGKESLVGWYPPFKHASRPIHALVIISVSYVFPFDGMHVIISVSQFICSLSDIMFNYECSYSIRTCLQ